MYIYIYKINNQYIYTHIYILYTIDTRNDYRADTRPLEQDEHPCNKKNY